MVKTFRFDDDYEEFSSNTYVVGTKGENCVIIDFGTTKRNIYSFISDNFSSVDAVLITHGHFDHIRGINKFLSIYPNVPVYIDINDKELLTDPKLNCSCDFSEKVLIDLKNINYFRNGDILKFKDLEFEIVETPYHTDGSVCILNYANKAVFTGDSLFKGTIGRSDLRTSNRNLIASSIEKIRNFDKFLNVYPGHGDTTTIEQELINNLYLRGGQYER